MKIFCVTSEAPYPVIHGGRVDIWNRYELLREAGCEIMLATWSTDPISSNDLAAMREVFDDIAIEPIRHSIGSMLKRAAYLPTHSPHVSSRFVSKSKTREICHRVAAFGADAVILEEPYGWRLGLDVASALSLPLLYRSHNVEFRFMRSQAAAATQWSRKLALSLASLHLEGLELRLQKSAQAVFDISSTDADYWRKRGVTRNLWLPTLFARKPTRRLDWTRRLYDAVFLGNLNAPNNVAGLLWFVYDVLPIVRLHRPDITICIAGSKPTQEIRKILESQLNIALVADPPDAEQIWSSGRVLINPVLTGSGINVKSAEMLLYDSPLVTTTVGARGFPDWLSKEFQVANAPHAFARLIVDALAQPDFNVAEARIRGRIALGRNGLDSMLNVLSQCVRK